MTHPRVLTPTTRGTIPCTLQDEDWNSGAPRIVAEEVVRGGFSLLEITVYHLRDREDRTLTDEDDAHAISDVVLLPRDAWETLVSMFAYRHAEAAARIVTRAQGWRTGTPGERGP